MEGAEIKGITWLAAEINGCSRLLVAYVVPQLEFPLILGKPWLSHTESYSVPHKKELWFGLTQSWLRHDDSLTSSTLYDITNAKEVLASVFVGTVRRIRRELGQAAADIAVCAVSIADVTKALQTKEPKSEVELRKQIPPRFHDLLPLFNKAEADKLNPRKPGIDHRIPLRTDDNGKEAAAPFGPLYSMSRPELLVLKKTLRELLDKGFIRASSSEAGAPVLFVRKPGGGLRFCCDYRGLNAVTKPDRYPLPLIADTLRNLAKAKWFTKLDVVQAFHKVRVAEGEEWKTAFRTRYGLFEWLVTPFGLSGAPATFQRYINKILQDFLDDFASAYIDDILIYTSGSKEDHMRKVRLVLDRLCAHGLHLDPDKCEFGVRRVKYLGFVIHAGVGIQADPDKIRAIRDWEAPTTQTGVRSFLGFANYYRMFIREFSRIVAPLNSITGKKVMFSWGPAQEDAFHTLKSLFAEAPLLLQWDFDRATTLEADCSGWALGGTLSQEVEGQRRPVAFHSRKLTSAERNYAIHDKEMLAIISCLEQWQAELRSCESFQILTDHRNLEYFMTRQHLSERQARWAEYLSRFNFHIKYRPGQDSAAPDALSRRDQDRVTKADIADRELQLIPQEALRWYMAATSIEEAPTDQSSRTNLGIGAASIFQDEDLQRLWDLCAAQDSTYQSVRRSVESGARTLDPKLRLKVQVGDCHIDPRGHLRCRGRLWVPGSSNTMEADEKDAAPEEDERNRLRSRLIQTTHDSSVLGHPGRQGTAASLTRDFYWPLLQTHVRRFLRNCDVCGRTKIWRAQQRGLLKQLPIPERFSAHIQMDFMTDLPLTEQGNRHLWVIKDRLSKEVILEPMPSMEAEACAERFLWCWARTHSWPSSITSDRGSNWTSRFWQHLCRLLRISQLLSTAYHPQTDGGPERINQEAQAYLRAVITRNQSDWDRWLPAAQLALNSRPQSSIGMSPFFALHGFEAPSPIPLSAEVLAEPSAPSSPEARATAFVKKLKETTDYCQSAMASTAQDQERNANKSRAPAERFAPGDKVWLDLRNFGSQREKKKLDWLHAKFTVRRVLSPQVVELEGLPTGADTTFNVDLLRRAANDPMPGQETADPQPPAILVEGENEFTVEEIRAARWKAVGRGKRREVLVKWQGYLDPTWEPAREFADSAALDRFETLYGPVEDNDGPADQQRAPPRRSARLAEATTTTITTLV